MAFAREIIQRILQNVRFRVPKTGEKDSYYTIIGNSLVRISNHCTYMYVWDNYLEKNPKCNNMNIVSIVFEDNDDTFHQNCLVLNRDRKKPIVIEEFVYPLHGNANFLTKDEVKNIIKSLKAIGTTNKFKEVTGKGIVNKRISINPTSQNVSVDNYGNNVYTTDIGHGVDYIAESIYNNQETNENKIMNKKQVIRLTESQFKQIVSESVKRIFSEGELSDEEWNEKHRQYSKQCVMDKFEYVLDHGGVGINDFLDEVIDILGCNAADNLAEKLIDNFELRHEYEQEDEILSGGYDRDGNPTITYTGANSGKRCTYALH